MQNYQRDFIEFALRHGALRFGDFTLKSGRASPYFFNIGLFNTGAALARLGGYYAAALGVCGMDFDMLFGPAYKGIPLVVAAAIGLAGGGRDVPVAFNRKEEKDHGEGGTIVGAPLQGRVLILDDVISSGLSVRESHAIITAHGAAPAGVLIALDRREQGREGRSAIEEVRAAYGIGVASIVTLDHLVEYLAATPRMEAILARVQAYRARYGVADR